MRIRNLPAELHRALKVWAAMRGVDMNTLAIELLAKAVKDSGPKIPPPPKD